jgi:hypothetical protein
MTTPERVKNWTDRMLSNSFFNDSETVVYTPSGGSPITINAHVYRRKNVEVRDFSNRSYTGSQLQYDLEVRVSRTDVTIVTKKSDTFTLPLNIGETPIVFRVSDVVGQDLGSIRLGLNI